MFAKIMTKVVTATPEQRLQMAINEMEECFAQALANEAKGRHSIAEQYLRQALVIERDAMRMA